VDPDSLNHHLDPDPAFQVNPDPDSNRIQGFDNKKIEERNFFFLFLIKIAIYLSLGLHTGIQATGEAFSSQKRTSSSYKK
jgi:hypothetical protein